MGRVEEVIRSIKEDFPPYLGLLYEKIAVECLWNQMDSFFPFERIGRWWERNEEIDVVGVNKQQNSILFGEVKWSEKPVGIDIYEDLKARSKKVQWGNEGRKEYFCLFSKKGFTENMMKVAKEDGVKLFKEDKPV